MQSLLQHGFLRGSTEDFRDLEWTQELCLPENLAVRSIYLYRDLLILPERTIETEQASIHGFTTQMVAMAKASSWSRTWVQGPKDLSASLLVFQAIQRELDQQWSSPHWKWVAPSEERYLRSTWSSTAKRSLHDIRMIHLVTRMYMLIKALDHVSCLICVSVCCEIWFSLIMPFCSLY